MWLLSRYGDSVPRLAGIAGLATLVVTFPGELSAELVPGSDWCGWCADPDQLDALVRVAATCPDLSAFAAGLPVVS